MNEPSLLLLLTNFMKKHRLPDDFLNTIDEYYLPLAQWIDNHRTVNRTWIIGLNGAQGTGKSTLSNVLKIILEQHFTCNTAIISLDDLYFPRADRKALAQSVHPLLQTRGVPGTHDTQLGIQTLHQLKHLKAGQTLPLPRFDKACDEPLSKDQWEVFTGPADVVIFEGWCMGSSAETKDALARPINQLESKEDKKALWRHYVNDKLQTTYRELFACNDLLIMLKAPNFECIHRWRWQQEQKLAATITADSALKQGTQLMDEAGITRFIQHYERLTRHNLAKLPEQADILLTLNEEHTITNVRYKEPFNKTSQADSGPRG
ncbi:MAG: phosphoribulokinase [Porticoccaceae bacterium]|nr:phosphoribulokinase [Porticoccaceae bacterium]